jgi:hypothetical protein
MPFQPLGRHHRRNALGVVDHAALVQMPRRRQLGRNGPKARLPALGLP